MRKVILALFVLFILQSCESEKDKAHKRILQIDKELISLEEYKERHINFIMDTSTNPLDTIAGYKWRDSLYAVTGKLERERDSLEIILHGH